MIGLFFSLIGGILMVYYAYEFFIRRDLIPSIPERWVLVTGCDSGFGAALARRLDSMGCHVFASCLTTAGVDRLKETCSSRTMTFLLDVSLEESVKGALQFVREHIGHSHKLWAIVNNAGISGSVMLPSPEFHIRKDFQDVLDVNLLGMADMMMTFLPLLKESRGRIVNMASIAGRSAPAMAWPYAVSKFGDEALSDSARAYLHQYGIKVSIIEPGTFATNILSPDSVRRLAQKGFDRLSDDQRKDFREDYVELMHQYMKDTILKRFANENLEPVVEAYVHALFAVHPKKRYVVGLDAALFSLLSYMPSAVQDAVQRYVLTTLPAYRKK